MNGKLCKVVTMCDPEKDTLAFRIESELIASNQLSVLIKFPYGDSGISGSDWGAEDRHTTELVSVSQNSFRLLRNLDSYNFV